ncbi:hypothetical protein B0H17DRAFT_1221438 [Mycena rosella]|uniref:Uncharacterized protein n=1 Tax=Mycena rosella TaxID=1033263 RepID=A0AAD7B3I3_MYCRO|nr:hypothetical protein B0H17DRAFT_1221438 [Mycena rosella]
MLTLSIPTALHLPACLLLSFHGPLSFNTPLVPFPPHHGARDFSVRLQRDTRLRATPLPLSMACELSGNATLRASASDAPQRSSICTRRQFHALSAAGRSGTGVRDRERHGHARVVRPATVLTPSAPTPGSGAGASAGGKQE